MCTVDVYGRVGSDNRHDLMVQFEGRNCDTCDLYSV